MDASADRCRAYEDPDPRWVLGPVGNAGLRLPFKHNGVDRVARPAPNWPPTTGQLRKDVVVHEQQEARGSRARERYGCAQAQCNFSPGLER